MERELLKDTDGVYSGYGIGTKVQILAFVRLTMRVREGHRRAYLIPQVYSLPVCIEALAQAVAAD